MESRFRVRCPTLFGALAVISALASCGFHPNSWTDHVGDRPWDEVVKDAVSVEIGMAAQGEMDHVGDRDFFRFEATEGEYYELDITLGTLQDYVLRVFNAVGTHLASYHSSAVSRLFWAPSTGPYYVPGPYYVKVTSDDTGTYTLTIVTSDFVDDHPDSADNATPVEIGVATQGELKYARDSDFFTFEATEGEYYELDVTLGTLQESVLGVLDADGNWLADYGTSTLPRLIWHVPATGTYYVRVASYSKETGTYTLTVSTSDIVDDHPNSTDNATPVQIGVATQGELEYEGDRDFFTFEATEGEFYQLDVTLGTLEDSVLYLFDAGIQLADDYGRSEAPRIGWYAPATGTYHVQVASFTTDIGTYALTVAAL